MSACRVQGRMSSRHSSHSAGMGAREHLHGGVADQAALHGLLARFDALGVEIVEFIRLPIT